MHAMRLPASRAILSVGLLVAALAVPAGAQPPPPALEGPPVAARFALANGLAVLVAERPGLPIVTARAVVEAGAAFDPPGRPGLANLTALLLTRGSGARSADEIDRAIEQVGGSLEAEGGRDTSELTLAVLRKDLALGLDLLADALVRPAFPPDELERKRDEVAAALRRSDEDPVTVAARALRRLAFPGHPYGNPVPGTEPSLRALTRDDVVAFHAATYRPERTVVAVAGDVTVDDVRSALEGRLGGWAAALPAPSTPHRAEVAAPPAMEAVDRDLAQATILLGQATVTRPHPDYYPLVVAAQVLGGGSASRLYTRIREERGLAYSTGAQYLPARFGGFLVVDLQCESARTREALALVREELVRLRRERVAEEELARAKAYLVGSFPLRASTALDLTELLVAIERDGLGLDYPTRFRRAVSAVTVDEVARAVRAHWDPDGMSLAVVGSLRAAGLGTP
jgi:zinc protease